MGFFERATGEEGGETGGAPGEVVEGHAGGEGHGCGGAGDGGFEGGPDHGGGDIEGEHDGQEYPDGGGLDGEEAEEGGEDGRGDHHSDEATGAEFFGEASGGEGDKDVGEAPGGGEPEAG